MKNFGRFFLMSIFALLMFVGSISAARVIRTTSGANAAAITTKTESPTSPSGDRQTATGLSCEAVQTSPPSSAIRSVKTAMSL